MLRAATSLVRLLAIAMAGLLAASAVVGTGLPPGSADRQGVAADGDRATMASTSIEPARSPAMTVPGEDDVANGGSVDREFVLTMLRLRQVAVAVALKQVQYGADGAARELAQLILAEDQDLAQPALAVRPSLPATQHSTSR